MGGICEGVISERVGVEGGGGICEGVIHKHKRICSIRLHLSCK